MPIGDSATIVLLVSIRICSLLILGISLTSNELSIAFGSLTYSTNLFSNSLSEYVDSSLTVSLANSSSSITLKYIAALSLTSSSISSKHLPNNTLTDLLTPSAPSTTFTPNLANDETAAALTIAFSNTTLL